uniref:site-specific DNA-methyltransferase (adenine-specific) n=1 Tax=mine drainage metagenome TaxID=410659 RepID=E6PLD0_9ZZZZ
MPVLDTATKRRIDSARDILVGKVPDPKSQVEQITIALIYKFMDDMDAESEELGGKRKFFTGDYARYGWARLMRSGLGGHETLNLYAEGIAKMPENAGIPPLFRDIFKNAYLPYRDPETLKSFLKIIDEFSYDHSERLGDAFEYLLSVLGSQGDAGQFRTPRHIIDFMVAVLDPKKTDTVLDPACGTAGFLISSWKHILKANSSPPLPLRARSTRHSPLPPGEGLGVRVRPWRQATFLPPTNAPASRAISRATTSRPTWCASAWRTCTCTASPTRTSSSTTPSPATSAGTSTPTSSSPTRPSCRPRAASSRTSVFPSRPSAAKCCLSTTWPSTSRRRVARPSSCPKASFSRVRPPTKRCASCWWKPRWSPSSRSRPAASTPIPG